MLKGHKPKRLRQEKHHELTQSPYSHAPLGLDSLGIGLNYPHSVCSLHCILHRFSSHLFNPLSSSLHWVRFGLGCFSHTPHHHTHTRAHTHTHTRAHAPARRPSRRARRL